MAIGFTSQNSFCVLLFMINAIVRLHRSAIGFIKKQVGSGTQGFDSAFGLEQSLYKQKPNNT